MKKEEYRRRFFSIEEKMDEKKVDALIIGTSAQLDQRGLFRWLLGYYLPVYEEAMVLCHGRSPMYFAHNGGSVFQLKEAPIQMEIQVIPSDTYLEDEAKPVAEYLRKIKAKRVAFAGMAGISAKYYVSLKRNIDVEIIDFSKEIAALRMVKTEFEIEQAREAVLLNEKSFMKYAEEVYCGNNEKNALMTARAYTDALGAEDQYWMSGAGSRTTAVSQGMALERASVFEDEQLVYVVAEHSVVGGVFGEVCQNIKLGKKDDEFEEAHHAVVAAILAAKEKIRTGNYVWEVAQAAENYLVKEGWLKADSIAKKPTPIGHGQGFDFWEYPSVIQTSQDLITPGIRFNLHPSVPLRSGNSVSYCMSFVSTIGEAERLGNLSTAPLYR